MLLFKVANYTFICCLIGFVQKDVHFISNLIYHIIIVFKPISSLYPLFRKNKYRYSHVFVNDDILLCNIQKCKNH